MTPQGYWRTGDIAELNDGRLILKGRLQERIRKQGYTLSPRDIEWALLKNPDIRECAVVGIAGSNGDDQLVYFIAGNTAAEQVDAFTRANLPSVWRPDRMIFLEALPRTSNGKISLLKLRAML
jgi:crotonobetaine/carnitine-CoA ligase